jgi:phosphoglycolate phosphatase
VSATSLRLIVFDCDGTIVDSQTGIVAKMTAAFETLGLLAPDPAAIRELIGLSLEETFARLLPGIGGGEIERLVAGYRHQFVAQRQAEGAPDPLFPHAGKVLRELNDAGFLLGVATGKSRRGLDAVLANHDLTDIFVTRQTGDGHPGKPHPAMLHQAMADTGVEAVDTMMIGDTSYDMAMAVNAGARPIGVAWGYHPVADLQAAGARVVVSDFCELAAYVGAQWPAD